MWWRLFAAPVAFERLVALLIWKAHRHEARILCHVSCPLKPWLYLTIGAEFYSWSCGTQGWYDFLASQHESSSVLMLTATYFMLFVCVCMHFPSCNFQTTLISNSILFYYALSHFSGSTFFAFKKPGILLGNVWWKRAAIQFRICILQNICCHYYTIIIIIRVST